MRPTYEALSTPAWSFPNPLTLVQSAPAISSWIEVEDSEEQISPKSTVPRHMKAKWLGRMVARRGPGGAVAGARTRGLSSDVFNEVGTAAVVVMDGGDECHLSQLFDSCIYWTQWQGWSQLDPKGTTRLSAAGLFGNWRLSLWNWLNAEAHAILELEVTPTQSRS